MKYEQKPELNPKSPNGNEKSEILILNHSVVFVCIVASFTCSHILLHTLSRTHEQ